MPKRCSVYLCKTGYDSQKVKENIPIYSFPRDPQNCQEWISALPNSNLSVSSITENYGVCANHWPKDLPRESKIFRGRHLVPGIPPSIFSPDIPPSCLPSHPRQSVEKKIQYNSKTSSTARNPSVDQTKEVMYLDSVSSHTRTNVLVNFRLKVAVAGIVACSSNSQEFVVLSQRRNGSIYNYSIMFTILDPPDSGAVTNVKFEAYQGLKLLKVPYGKNSIVTLWSQLQEVLRFVRQTEEEVLNGSFQDLKMNFLLNQIRLYNTTRNGRLYEHEDICQAFSWYARSRALYSELRNFLQLPSVTTLRRMTRVSKNLEDNVLFGNFFSQQEERSRACILIVDEIYVKASVSYSGGLLFGYSEDHLGKLASTLLCVMVKCLFSSKKFLVKLVPCHALTANFQYTIVSTVISTLESCGAKVLAIINDNNKVNQSYFKLFPGFNEQSPWMVNFNASWPLFLLFDPVHLIKNFRNNWITEKSQSLLFPCQGPNNPERKVAKWSDLRDLFHHESIHDTKLSQLTGKSVNPSNLEKQKVSLAMNVFSDRTVVGLETSEISTDSMKDTACFIRLVIKLWKVLNCKSPTQHIRLADADRVAITNTEEGQRGKDILNEWAQTAVIMRSTSSARVQSLTKDTATACEWTCRGLLALSSYLLGTTLPFRHQFVCLGFFQQDDLEHHFGHFRRSAGCNYFLTVRQNSCCPLTWTSTLQTLVTSVSSVTDL